MAAELSVNDHLEGILSDFEALKRSFDVEDIDDLPAFSPSSPPSSPFSPTSPGMALKSNGESRRSPGLHLPMYQSHISISTSPGHSPALKNRIGSSLSFNRGTIQMARSNGSAHASLTRVSSFQTRLQPNGFSSSGPGSDSESLHSSTSSLEWQPASKLVTPMRPSQLSVGMYEPSVRIARISSPVLKKFSSSHGSVFHSEVERSIARPVTQDAVNHSSLHSLDLHIAEDQGSDLIPSPNTAYPSSAGWSSPSQNRTPLLAKHAKPVSREPSFSSSSSSSSPPPYGVGRPDRATPPPFIRPAQPTKLHKFPITLDGWLGRPTDCQNLVSEVHVVPKSLPRTQLKVSAHANCGSLNPTSTVRENVAETLRSISVTATPERFPGGPSPCESLTPPLSPPEERRFHPASPPQVVQLPSPISFFGLGPLQQANAPVQPVPRDNLQSMMERALSFARVDRASPGAIACPQDTHPGSRMSMPTEEPEEMELQMENKAEEDAQVVCYLQRQDEWKIQNGREARSEPDIGVKEEASRIPESYPEPAWTGMECDRQPAAEEEDGAERGPQPAGMGREPFGYVGIESVLDQMRRKAMKTGFEFNIMVVGQSGLGKSTLVNTLFKSKISRKSSNSSHDERIPKTVELKSISHVIEEKGLKMKLTVIDTPGFGDQINNQQCWEPIVKYIQEQYDKYLSEEIVINRKRQIPDTRIHCCIYFVPPTGHWLRPLDVEFMKRLGKVVNMVPVIAKADTLTLEEREDFKRQIRKDLQAHGISVYPQRELDEDPEDTLRNDKIREKIPFAVVGTDQEHQVNGKMVLGRKTKWGIIEVENEAHCEFANLRDLLIRSNLQDLKDITQNIHYEIFRIQRLTERNLERGLHGGGPIGKESNF